jgi:RHS repeat-associated protein
VQPGVSWTAASTYTGPHYMGTKRLLSGQKRYEIANHLGNVLTTIGDRKIPVDGAVADNTAEYYTAVVHSAQDYYPFGMEMPGRSFQSGGYRYGFNGKEKDPTEFGSLTHFDYGFRIYNPALGRFLSVDPLKKEYPELTPYQFASNTPIQAIDLDGLEAYYAADGKFLGKLGDETEVRVVSDANVKEAKKYINWTETAISEEHKNYNYNHLNNDLSTKAYDNHDEFMAMAGVLYAEADGTTSDAVNEVAGIYSVLENRANYEGTTVRQQMTVAKGVYGVLEVDKINKADKTGMSVKKDAVIAGLIKGIQSREDFSNGAFYWDGTDFKSGGGHTERYNPGFQFTDPSHDLYNQGDKMKSGTANKVSWLYKYQSTAAIGNILRVFRFAG